METYSGGPRVNNRTQAYIQNFPQVIWNATQRYVPNSLMRISPAVVGLTEINSFNQNGILQVMGAIGVQFQACLRCGFTALQETKNEFVAIGVDTLNFAVVARGVERIRDSADYRDIAYASVREIATGRTFAAAFLHNMYSLATNRATTMMRLPDTMRELRQRLGVEVYLGGDFNVRPINRSRYRSPLQQRSAVPNAYPHGFGIQGGTTWSGNTYDYWFTAANTQPPLAANAALAWAETMDGGPNHQALMSDHCAITLVI